MSNMIVARRKGIKVRMFDTSTAKMGPWMTDYPTAIKREQDRIHGESLDQLRRAEAYVAERERMGRLVVIHNAASLESMTNARIREVGNRVLGITFPSKARKADMVTAYLAAQAEVIA